MTPSSFSPAWPWRSELSSTIPRETSSTPRRTTITALLRDKTSTSTMWSSPSTSITSPPTKETTMPPESNRETQTLPPPTCRKFDKATLIHVFQRHNAPCSLSPDPMKEHRTTIAARNEVPSLSSVFSSDQVSEALVEVDPVMATEARVDEEDMDVANNLSN
eukprot:snap_masked-scaffold266_size231069-processed-gene-1.19 protein:Tk12008 transcript:snap_masked-scaffold266_size231069-processed-gene-1.19-mRNA-1 annotation:"merzoite surface protein 1"